MVFSSLLFIFLFLPVTLLLYYLARSGWRNFVLTAVSVVFYGWGAPGFLPLLLVNIVVDYGLALAIAGAGSVLRKKQLIGASLAINLGLLAYFKYANFFVQEVGGLLAPAGAAPLHWTAVALPIGISFFVFHKISYVMDVYRGTEKPFTNLPDYTLYILFFPQLIAGPIVRFHEIAHQIREREHTANNFFAGIWHFAIGLGKKTLLANQVAGVVDKIFALPPGELSIGLAWFGIILYAFQIYFDFSGYSDMAIGLGKMFGFTLPENFNRPYIAKSITDFWRRWHMSLSRFFKDYLYIPLGGNRTSPLRNYLNLWTVFVLCGFWHGANWTFLVWGIFHGMLLVLDKIFLLSWLKRLPNIARNLLTFVLVLIGWVFFRSETLAYALGYLQTMFNGHFASLSVGQIYELGINNKVLAATVAGCLFCFAPDSFFQRFTRRITPAHARTVTLLQGSVSLLLLVYSLASLAGGSFNPFIYFRF